MVSAIQSALGGINRSTANIGVAAHNVANFNTDGFRAQRLDGAGTLRPRHAPPPDDGENRSDVDLAEEFIDIKINEHAFRANAFVVRVADRMTGELLDLLA